mgnify:CR=1 FL=1
MWKGFAQKGVFLALAAAALPVFIGGMGLAFDVGMVCLHKAQLQNAADAAVIAGGHAYSEQLETSDTADAVDRFGITKAENLIFLSSDSWWRVTTAFPIASDLSAISNNSFHVQ